MLVPALCRYVRVLRRRGGDDKDQQSFPRSLFQPAQVIQLNTTDCSNLRYRFLTWIHVTYPGLSASADRLVLSYLVVDGVGVQLIST